MNTYKITFFCEEEQTYRTTIEHVVTSKAIFLAELEMYKYAANRDFDHVNIELIKKAPLHN